MFEMGNLSRRGFLQRSLAGLVGAGLPLWYAHELLEHEARADDEAKKPVAANDKLNVALIGCGGQGRGIMGWARRESKAVQVVAVCDVDRKHREQTIAKDFKGSKDVKDYEDFRELLDRKDINAVLIGTPDHWHTLIAIDAMRKGKDVYCEKPLTLTVAEGQALVKVARATKRIFQVGSQQRSDARFRLACALARNNRLGKIKTIETRIGENPKGGPFKPEPVPEGLNWDFWLGQTPKVDYIKQRCHSTFRWWYEYSGGKMTDWGAHMNDIAQWALGMDDSGPVAVVSKGKEPSRDPNSYNCHETFEVTYTYDNGAQVICKSARSEGVRIEGEDGKWIDVSRSRITASDQAEKPVPGRRGQPGKKGGPSKILDEPIPKDGVQLYVSNNHMRNWLDGIKTRKTCICPAEVGHRSVTVCHIGVISLRLGGKKLKWDPVREKFDDDEANKMLSRTMRGEWKLET
jgi:predicted dehydrogenase